MESEFYTGARLSYGGDLCTVRYIGEVQGTKGLWLGVEWDDQTRGTHSGERGGKRYFECKSKQPKAGSFVRPSRSSDQPLSFLEALRKKYAPESEGVNFLQGADHVQNGADVQIEISGKIVEEVGFEKIRQLLANLKELRIVLLDGFCMRGVLKDRSGSENQWSSELARIEETCPNILELDLSFNLFEDWRDLQGICYELRRLKSLKVVGNRFRKLNAETPELKQAFRNVKELSLDDTLLSWLEICQLLRDFPNLTSLSASSNLLNTIESPLPLYAITHLVLDNNCFTSLSNLRVLADSLSNLTNLSLRLNSITEVYHATSPMPFSFSPSLSTLDLSRNLISTWSFISTLPSTFPGLSSLRTSHNPLYESLTIDEAHVLTLARLPTLKVLNFSSVNARERENAELYYLSRIGKELSSSVAADEVGILATHPRYEELCAQYGPPTITRAADSLSSNSNLPIDALAHRLINFTFYITSNPGVGQRKVSVSKEIPKAWDVYRVKGVVYRLFLVLTPPVNLKPMQFRLIWETGEYDPSSSQVDVGSDDEESVVNEWEAGAYESHGEMERRGKWVKRETELVDSTRAVGFWFDDGVKDVKVRVEPR